MNLVLNKQTLAGMIDHTALSVETSRADLERVCDEVRSYGFASVCVHPHWVVELAPKYSDIRFCTVIGFPLGLQTIKLYEGQKAAEAGAVELDIVVNHAWVMDQQWENIAEELISFRRVFPELTLKLIIETCRLDEPQIIKLCQLAVAASFDWIKTSTGFATAGATVKAVRLMKAHCQNGMQVKASGGIRTLKAVEEMIAAGATRIGSSSGLSILRELDVMQGRN